jgi:hypothetical protein
MGKLFGLVSSGVGLMAEAVAQNTGKSFQSKPADSDSYSSRQQFNPNSGTDSYQSNEYPAYSRSNDHPEFSRPTDIPPSYESAVQDRNSGYTSRRDDISDRNFGYQRQTYQNDVYDRETDYPRQTYQNDVYDRENDHPRQSYQENDKNRQVNYPRCPLQNGSQIDYSRITPPPEDRFQSMRPQAASMPDPRSNSGRLPMPIIIPQRRPGTKDRGWAMAYSPVLQSCDIDKNAFIAFLYSFNEACKVFWPSVSWPLLTRKLRPLQPLMP